MENTLIKLEKPLKRGDNEVSEITLHKPNAGALRGVSLRECIDMNTDAIVRVIPRISDPKITEQEMQRDIEPSDLLQMGAALANFLLPPSLIAEAEKQYLSQTE